MTSTQKPKHGRAPQRGKENSDKKGTKTIVGVLHLEKKARIKVIDLAAETLARERAKRRIERKKRDLEFGGNIFGKLNSKYSKAGHRPRIKDMPANTLVNIRDKPHTKHLSVLDSRIKLLLRAWRANSALSALPVETLNKLAQIASEVLSDPEVIVSQVEQVDRLAPIVDPVTGLELPPKPGLPYSQRGMEATGKRRKSLLEHLRSEYPRHLEESLLTASDLANIDNSAYQRIRYEAKKEAKAAGETLDGAVARYCRRNGIITMEDLRAAEPLPGLERQITLLRAVYTKRVGEGHRQGSDKILTRVQVVIDTLTK